jgi:glutathione reductase (NADPH)
VPADGPPGITSNEAFHLPALPERIVVIGGGYVACEFASIFNGLGARVTQAYRGEQILRGFDRDVRDHLAAELRKTGIDLRLGVTVADASGIDADVIMYATGRRPRIDGLGLEAAGVRLDSRGAIAVDQFSRTSADGIHAIGDCTGRVNLTPVAIREGAAFADTVFGGKPTAVDHETVPSAVFSNPPVAVVGLDEEAARAKFAALDIYKSVFRPMKHTLTGRDRKTLMKLVVDRASGRVLGAHMVGDDAPEIIQMASVAVKMGATKADFDRTMAIHPTAAEEFVLMRAPVSS